MTCLVCLAPEGAAMLGVGSQDNTIRLLDLNTGRVMRTLVGHTTPPTCLAFGNPDGKRLVLASGGQDNVVRIWDPGTGQQVGILKNINRPVRSVAFSADSRVAAVGDDGPVVRLWDVYTGQLRQELRGHTQAVTSVAYSADGKLLASAAKTIRPGCGTLAPEKPGWSSKGTPSR